MKKDSTAGVFNFSKGESSQELIEAMQQKEKMSEDRLRELWENATPEQRKAAYAVVSSEGDAG